MEFFIFTGEHTKEGKLLEKLYQAVKPIPGIDKGIFTKEGIRCIFFDGGSFETLSQ
jgi:hypothetical protein